MILFWNFYISLIFLPFIVYSSSISSSSSSLVEHSSSMGLKGEEIIHTSENHSNEFTKTIKPDTLDKSSSIEPSCTPDFISHYIWDLCKIINELKHDRGLKTKEFDSFYNSENSELIKKSLIHIIKCHPQMALLVFFLLKRIEKLAEWRIRVRGKKKMQKIHKSFLDKSKEEMENGNDAIRENLEKYIDFISSLIDGLDIKFSNNPTDHENHFMRIFQSSRGKFELKNLVINNFNLWEYLPKKDPFLSSLLPPIFSERIMIQKVDSDDKFLRMKLKDDYEKYSLKNDSETLNNLSLFWIKYFYRFLVLLNSNLLRNHIHRVIGMINNPLNFQIVSMAIIYLLRNFDDYLEKVAKEKSWEISPSSSKRLQIEGFNDKIDNPAITNSNEINNSPSLPLIIFPLVPFIHKVKPAIYDEFNDFMISLADKKKTVQGNGFSIEIISENRLKVTLSKEIKSVFITHESNLMSRLNMDQFYGTTPIPIEKNYKRFYGNLASNSFGWRIERTDLQENNRTFILEGVQSESIISLSTKEYHNIPRFLDFKFNDLKVDFKFNDLKVDFNHYCNIFMNSAKSKDFLFLGIIGE